LSVPVRWVTFYTGDIGTYVSVSSN